MNFDVIVPLIILGLAILPVAFLLAIAMARFHDDFYDKR